MGVILNPTMMLMMGLAMWPFGTRIDLSTPIATMRMFQKAIHAKNWSTAAECLSEEIRKENADFLGKSILYTTSYWQPSRGMESFFQDEPPLIEKSCTFKLLSENQLRATIEVVYPRQREKAVRLKTITLERNAEGFWKIAEIFGVTAPPR
ncbi:MAG: hypothetical protein VBE63_25090 [Lamprobacter sp.]|uniref:hypothetical protein n=1 Tax=Lamprobacter sp. TaxID=3100796 RepID=UPI002B25FC64|nr:hypothetical protein [Lamprobacter sp.]MEA3643188.1 hypothetical protein [Lamprobacter sp.]